MEKLKAEVERRRALAEATQLECNLLAAEVERLREAARYVLMRWGFDHEPGTPAEVEEGMRRLAALAPEVKP